MRVAVTLAASVTALAASVAGAQAPPGGGGLVVFASERAPDFHRVMLLETNRRGGSPTVLAELPEGAVAAPAGRRYARAVARGSGRYDLVVGEPGGGETTIVTQDDSIEDIAWAPSGRRLAYAVADTSRCGSAPRLCAIYELWTVGANGSDPRKIADAARLPTWSPDERRLAFSGDWNTAEAAFLGYTGTPHVAFANGRGQRALARIRGVDALAWSPRGDRIAVGAHRGFVAVVSLRGGDARKVGLGSAPAWSPRGQLAFAGESAILVLARVGGPVRRIRANGAVREIVWSPSGAELAYVTAFSDSLRRPEGAKLVVAVRADGRARRVVFRADRFATVDLVGWRPGASSVRLTTTRVENDTDLFVMRGDGTALRAVTTDAEWDSEPAWSPDGRRIVFTRGFPGNFGFPQTAVHVVDAAGGASAERITSPTAGTDDHDPDWSPDGTWIVFSRSLAASGLDRADLFLCRPDGAGLVQLTRLEGSSAHPAWSPDGRKIVFSRGREVWVVDADGGNPHSLGLAGGHPAWSPDGRRIAFLGAVDNRLTFQIANADGSERRVVPTGVTPAWGVPTWSPDGTRLLFAGEDQEIHSIAVGGGTAVRVTASLGRDEQPAWSGSAGG